MSLLTLNISLISSRMKQLILFVSEWAELSVTKGGRILFRRNEKRAALMGWLTRKSCLLPARNNLFYTKQNSLSLDHILLTFIFFMTNFFRYLPTLCCYPDILLLFIDTVDFYIVIWCQLPGHAGSERTLVLKH